MSDVGAVAARIEHLLRERPRTFYELLREARRLGRDAHGLYLLRQT